MASLRWLHISDVHRGASGDDARWPELIRALKTAVADDVAVSGPLAFVVVTGDLSFSGSEFDKVSAAFEELEGILGDAVPWFTVPGNHDLVRPPRDGITADLARRYFEENGTLRRGLKRRTPESLKMLGEPFSAYSSWVETFLHPRWRRLGVQWEAGALPGDYRASVPVEGMQIGVVGVNSSYLHFSDDVRESSLAIEAEQTQVGAVDLGSWASRHDFSLLLMHHPPDWLHPLSRQEFTSYVAPTGRFAACHYGHMHAAVTQMVSYSQTEARLLIQAPSLHGLEHYGTAREQRLMGFTVCELAVPTRTTSTSLTVAPYALVRQASGNLAVRADPTQDPFQAPVQLTRPPRAAPAAAASPPADAGEIVVELRSDRSDPPQVVSWVGRTTELDLILGPEYRVAAIAGIGGQGKSYLAAKAMDTAKSSAKFSLLDWRDCREQRDRLHSVLISQIHQLSDQKVGVADLTSSKIVELVDLLLDVIGNRTTFLVYDNVDSYVDVEQAEPVSGLQHIIARTLARAPNVKVVLTCRPEIHVDSPAFLSLPLGGLSHAEVLRLFELRGIDTRSSEMRDLVARMTTLTRGHPLWLSLIAAQLRTRPKNVERMVALGLGSPDVPTPQAILDPIWQDLGDVEVAILRTLAEAMRPHSDRELAKLIPTRRAGLQAARNAIARLVKLHLLVVTAPALGPERFALHPVVRAFVQRRYSTKERGGVITILIARVYDSVLGAISAATGSPTASLTEDTVALHLERVELLNNSGNQRLAVKALSSVWRIAKHDGLAEEFVRVGANILATLDLDQAIEEQFEGTRELIDAISQALSELGRSSTAVQVLEAFEHAISPGGADFVALCSMRSYLHWYAKEYAHAIEWADRGQALKDRADFDTDADCRHHRSLALRDMGRHEEALENFIALADAHSLEEIESRFDPERPFNGPVFGNVGRCLQFQQDWERALRLVSISYYVLEQNEDYHNLGFASLWLHEILQSRGDAETSALFAEHCFLLWEFRAPLRAKEVKERVPTLPTATGRHVRESEVSSAASQWVRRHLKSCGRIL